MARRKRQRGNRTNKSSQQDCMQSRTTNKQSMSALLDWFLADADTFSNIKFHGNTRWSPECLVRLAVLWAWSESRNLTDAFEEAARNCRTLLASSPLSTYQGFMWAMTRWTSTFLPLLCLVLQARLKAIGGKFWQVDGWVPIAFDGSRSTAPRTKANEQKFCAPNYGKGKTAKYRKKKSQGMRRKQNQRNKPQPQQPQAWITMMWHMGLRLPWLWRLGPSNSSEREHVMDMLNECGFPLKTLFCGDAGFVGYPLWERISSRGRHFLVRVGANVSLLTSQADYKLQNNNFVLCWPRTMRNCGARPLRLRLVKVRIGKTSMWLMTNVLDSERLTAKQMIKLYRMRWGIEVEFRGLKQTLDRATLRCRNDQRVLVELDWSILAMAVAELFALKEQLAPRIRSATAKPPDPIKRSLAGTMRALRGCLSQLNEVPEPKYDLASLLRTALTDDYQRKASKVARYRPPNPDKKPLGDPKIRKLDPQERKQLECIKPKMAA